MPRLLILLLCAAAVGAPEPAEALIRRLSHPHPRARRLAQEELVRRGAAAVPALLAHFDAEDLDTRRFVRTLLSAHLREGDRLVRDRVLEAVGERPSLAPGFAASIDELTGARYVLPETRYLAMTVAMRLRNDRRYVRALAEAAVTGPSFVAERRLRAFDPARGGVLIRALERVHGTGGVRPERRIKTFVDQLAEGGAKADEALAQSIRSTRAVGLPAWVDLLREYPRLPAAVGPALQERLGGTAVEARAIVRALAQAENDWAAVAAPLRDAARAGLARDSGVDRVPWLLLLARCARTDPEAARLLAARAEDARDSVAAQCVLHAAGVRVFGDPVARFAALDDEDRAAEMFIMLGLAAREFVPVFRDRLRRGSAFERDAILDAADQMAAAGELIDEFAAIVRGDDLKAAGFALTALVRCDPRLARPVSVDTMRAALAHDLVEVRQSAVYQVDDLTHVPEAVAGALADRLEDPPVYGAMKWTLSRLGRLGDDARAAVPLLARIARDGGPAGTDASDWRRGALKALADVAPDDPRARVAFRASLRVKSPGLQMYGLFGFRRVARPTAEDVAAVRHCAEFGAPKLRRHAEALLDRPGWR